MLVPSLRALGEVLDQLLDDLGHFDFVVLDPTCGDQSFGIVDPGTLVVGPEFEQVLISLKARLKLLDRQFRSDVGFSPLATSDPPARIKRFARLCRASRSAGDPFWISASTLSASSKRPQAHQRRSAGHFGVVEFFTISAIQLLFLGKNCVESFEGLECLGETGPASFQRSQL